MASSESSCETIRIHRHPPVGGSYEFLLTSYMLGAPDGKNMGAPGYSHEFVARLFRPLLERWGAVRDIRDAARELQAAVADCRQRGAQPVHFSVLPFQDVSFPADAPTIVMPAWEFPDVPDHAFNDNPQNDWPATAARSELVLVSGPFTESALRRGGTTAPIEIVPVPTPDAYFMIDLWASGRSTTVDCWAFEFPGSQENEPTVEPKIPGKTLAKSLEKTLRTVTRRMLGAAGYDKVSRLIKTRRTSHRQRADTPDFRRLPYRQVEQVTLSGIVYTSILNPGDGRKNWQDLLTGFLISLADRDDATLVVKLISKNQSLVQRVIHFYRGLGLRHRCRLVVICDYLTDEQMLQLCRGTTYYLQSSKAEGNCLPLMNYLSAGRPGISPDHSSMGDYFSDRCGFVVESHPEPSAWPHDKALRIRTTWGRIVWSSLRDQIAASYRLAHDVEAYAALAAECRRHMTGWASYPAVAARLDAALGRLLGPKRSRPLTDLPATPLRRAA